MRLEFELGEFFFIVLDPYLLQQEFQVQDFKIIVNISERIGQCVDDPAFSKNGMTCDKLVLESTIRECYDPAVETACCLSCTQVNIGIDGTKFKVFVLR